MSETTEPAVGRIALRPLEAFAALGLSTSAGWRLIKSGELPSVRIGRMRLVPLVDLNAWLADELARQREARTFEIGEEDEA